MKIDTTQESKERLQLAHKELSNATDYMRSSLINWEKRLLGANYLYEEEKKFVYLNYKSLLSEVNLIREKLALFTRQVNKHNTDKDFEELIEQKKKLYALFRICLSQYASLMTCLNWQAPSIKSSMNTRIGIEKAPIEADWNDYKRDRSGDTFACESMIEKNTIFTSGMGVNPITNIFNSGMGAFTCIIYFLINEDIVKNRVLASSQIYVENRILLKSFFKNNLDIFTHNNTDKIIKHILSAEPNAVFIEPLSNTNNLRLFEVSEIVKAVAKKHKKDIYFILDVTCILGFENIFEEFNLPKNIKIILHGSILKSPQLGLERINAGFVQTYGLEKLSDKILDYRTMSGTNIQDYATNLLAFTTKELLQKRMKIIEENAVILAEYVSDLDPNHEIISEVIYPRLKSHPDYDISKKMNFTGSFFNIKFIPHMNNDKYFALLTNEIIKSAKEYNCDIVHGASFGFNHTSVYYSVGWDEPENHYLRISTGTETIYEIEKIKLVFKDAFINFKEQHI